MSSKPEQEKPATVDLETMCIDSLAKHFGMNYSWFVREKHAGCKAFADKCLAEINRRFECLEAERDRIKARHDSMLEALKHAEAGLFLASGAVKTGDGERSVSHCLKRVQNELEKAKGKK